jgi:hypothetical protein
MCIAEAAIALQVASTLSSASAARKQSEGTKQAYEQQAAVDRANADLLDYRASDALERGSQEQFRHGLKVASLEGTQRATFASRGVALDEGTPLNVLMDTKFMGDLDRTTIADNAAREAWALRYQARNIREHAGYAMSRADAEDPSRAATGTLLSGAGSVATNWYRMTRGPTTTPSPSEYPE